MPRVTWLIFMPSLLLQTVQLIANVTLLLFVAYYFLKLRSKEAELDKREGKADKDYHQVVDDALAKERRILEDATKEANQIISGAQYISQSSKQAVDTALQKMVAEIESGAISTSREFMNSYSTALKQLTLQSLGGFQNAAKELEVDLQGKIKEFHDSLLPNLEKELETYKQTRLKEVDGLVSKVVHKVSQEVLNKSISLDDHQTLVIQSLEKAKQQGVFD